MKKSKRNISHIMKSEIKQEPDDIKSLANYIDDRVQLVKQIFQALKPKTIRSLAPEFMKKLDISEIEELCLNELLGISTKRLNSVIDATKCPTDTDSSSDTEVENIEELISLEEISSDSDATANNAGTKSKKKRKILEKNQPENTKEVSVLELLELQARARAIRSQLALEPVTKIEVDSDDSHESETNITKVENHRSSSSKLKSKNITNGSYNSKMENAPKPVKLKRNFRKHIAKDDSDENEPVLNENTLKEKTPRIEAEDIAPSPSCVSSENQTNPISKRSPSPDVITILQSPETLCISDSSNDGDLPMKTSISCITDEKFGSTENSNTDGGSNSPTGNLARENNEAHESEIEDGEILEKEDESGKLMNVQNKEVDNQHFGNSTLETLNAHTESNSKTEDNTQQDSWNISESCTEAVSNKDNDTENQNDDAISLEHDDLDYEMRDQLDDETNEKQSPRRLSIENNMECKVEDSADFIELHDEDSTADQEYDNECQEKVSSCCNQIGNQSWSSRWLRSSKVSKILATSKLGNRLRYKIKNSKRFENENDENSSESINNTQPVYQSKFPEGSTQQYREIGSINKTP